MPEKESTSEIVNKARVVPAIFDRSLIKTLAVAELVGFSIITFLIWWAAYLNNNRVVITINDFGEAPVELVLWLVSTPILVLGLHYIVIDGNLASDS
jgi:hypothetical protein